MKFFQAISKKVALLKPTEAAKPAEILRLPEIISENLPTGILELAKLTKPEASVIKASSLVIPSQLIQDFWAWQGLDKKIKNQTTTINLRHPRSLSSAAASIQRLISRQTLPSSWKNEWKKLHTALPKNTKADVVFALYFETETIGRTDWLPTFTAPATEAGLLKLLRQSLSALYSERFLREREQRGFGHAHLPVSILVSVRASKKTDLNFKLITNIGSKVASLQINGTDFSLYKPAVASKKALFLNAWTQTLISETLVAAIVAPILEIEKHTHQTIVVTGSIDLTKNQATVWQLDVLPAVTTENKVEYNLKTTSQILGTGKFFGQGIAVGQLAVIRNPSQIIESGDIVVAKNFSLVSNTNLSLAAGLIIEDASQGAEIKLRTLDLTVPVLLGTKHATKRLRTGTTVTIALTAENGAIYAGALPYEVKPIVTKQPKIKTELRTPEITIALDDVLCELNNRHPLDYFAAKQTANYAELLGQKLAESIAKKDAPRLMVAMSSSTPSVFVDLSGGAKAERLLHLRQSARGAERYLHNQYTRVFAAECTALKAVRDRFGLQFTLTLPYCRSVSELEEFLTALKKQGISREQGWRFSLATDLPGHALLTESLARQIDELIFDLDSLVKSTTGERSKTMTAIRQKTVEQALSAIAKTAAKEKTTIALSGEWLAREPQLVFSAVKSGIKTLIVNHNESAAVHHSAYEAERSVGKTFGTNHQLLGLVAGFACLGALIMTVGAGCGMGAKVPETPQLTPAQIRAEIMSAIAEEREQALNENTTATVTGFADFKVTHPRRFEALYSPKTFTLKNAEANDALVFSALTKFGSTSSTDFMTKSGLPGKLFTFVTDTTTTSPIIIYEVELKPNSILKIETGSTAPATQTIIESIQAL